MRRLSGSWCRPAFLIAISAGVWFAPGVFAEDCSLQRLVEAPMLPDEAFSPAVSIEIDGKARRVQLDTGGFWSMIDPNIAIGYTPRRAALISRLGLQSIPLISSVKVPSLQIGAGNFQNAEFYLAPPGYLRFDATLGANWLAAFDVEIDPVRNIAALFSKDHCDGQVVHWPHQDETVAIIPFELERGNHITLPIRLNGEEVQAMLDTGSPDTFLSTLAAKKLFGLTPDSPGMELVDTDIDGRGRKHPFYRYQFKSLEMGNIGFTNPWITITDMADGSVQLILGMHQLHALHLYFAYNERKLYATSARDDIAAWNAAGDNKPAAATPTGDPIARIDAQDYRQSAYAALQKKDVAAAGIAIEKAIQSDPSFAEAYVTRAGIHQMKNEHDLALRDYDEALRRDPDNFAAFTDRARMKWASGDRPGALADAGQAIRRNPANINGYLLRAGFEVTAGDWNNAMLDANEAVRIAPTEAEGVSARAQVYAGQGDYQRALEDQTIVVKMKPRSPGALNNRCWFGAILGKLDDALDDCNSALSLESHNATALDSRAFVRLKMGQWDRAVNDYDAALAIDAKLASSLYGRAQAKQGKGDNAGAAVDIDAAKKIDPDIVKHFGR